MIPNQYSMAIWSAMTYDEMEKLWLQILPDFSRPCVIGCNPTSALDNLLQGTTLENRSISFIFVQCNEYIIDLLRIPAMKHVLASVIPPSLSAIKRPFGGQVAFISDSTTPLFIISLFTAIHSSHQFHTATTRNRRSTRTTRIDNCSHAMAPNQTRVRSYSEKKDPALPSPSASIILVSPTNTCLLLHRKNTSSAFPSAHVFPGGNLDPQDGQLPPSATDVNRHKESLPYRIGAIRELFEETGILLAKESFNSTSLLKVSDEARLAGRKAVHSGKIPFPQWLKEQSSSAVLHTEGLIPFTHWITPPNVPKRFTTQMYVYFVHLKETNNPSIHATSDEVETMHPEYKVASEWIKLAQKGDVILFPPQFLLLHLVAQFLDVEGTRSAYGHVTAAEIVERRRKLYEFITQDRSPVPWTEKYISPIGGPLNKDKRQTLMLNSPGPELKNSGLVGDDSRVVVASFQKEGPRQLEVRWKSEVLAEDRERQAANSKL